MKFKPQGIALSSVEKILSQTHKPQIGRGLGKYLNKKTVSYLIPLGQTICDTLHNYTSSIETPSKITLISPTEQISQQAKEEIKVQDKEQKHKKIKVVKKNKKKLSQKNKAKSSKHRAKSSKNKAKSVKSNIF